MARSAYDHRYRAERLRLLAQRLPCELRLVCDGAVADSADHDPPLSAHGHVPGSGCCRLLPACLACQHLQGGILRFHPPRRGVPKASRIW